MKKVEKIKLMEKRLEGITNDPIKAVVLRLKINKLKKIVASN